MTDAEIYRLIQQKPFPFGETDVDEVIETHISWVLLTSSHAYKIKKPLRLNFLDFTTLDQRHFYCKEEVRLNQRFSQEMYLKVIPIYLRDGQLSWTAPGSIVDYTVVMKRMDTSREMLFLLEHHNLQASQIEQLAQTIAYFHASERSLVLSFDPFFLATEFADIASLLPALSGVATKKMMETISTCIQQSTNFIQSNAAGFIRRAKEGYVKDCHGDLHLKNIFITDTPVLFDCIEFKASFREIDVLNDIAFLAMDLEAHGAEEWSVLFVEKYQEFSKIQWTLSDNALFLYYKAFRACIRAKVNALAWLEHPEDTALEKEVIRYVELMADYCSKLN